MEPIIALSNIRRPNVWLEFLFEHSFQSRPSVLSSSHHQHQPFASVVNPEPVIPNSNVFQWSATSPSLSTQQPSSSSTSFLATHQQPRFSPMTVPQAGVPWRCPDWMVNQNIQPGSYMSFNGQQHSRLPFKRKGEAELEAYVFISDRMYVRVLNQSKKSKI